MDPKTYFSSPGHVLHKHYEALRAFFVDGASAEDASREFGYTTSSFYSLVRDFKQRIANECDPRIIEQVRYVSGRMSGCFENPGHVATEHQRLSFTDCRVNSGNAILFRPWPDNGATVSVLQSKIAARMIRVMMGRQNVSQCPVFRGELCIHSVSIRCID